MVHGTVSPGPPFEVGDFGSDVERSAKGAIYFRPRQVWHITPGELVHIEAAHPDLAKRLVVLKRPRGRSAPQAPAPEPAQPAKTVATDPVDVEDEAKTEEDPGSGEDSGDEVGSPEDGERPRKRRSRKKPK